MTRALTTLLLLVLAATAFADGKIVARKAVLQPVRTPDQRALLCYDAAKGEETLVIETSFAGSGREFAWILPLPAAPRIEASTTGLFPTLESLTAPEVDDRPSVDWLFALVWGAALWAAVRWWRRPVAPQRLVLGVASAGALGTAACAVIALALSPISCSGTGTLGSGPGPSPTLVRVVGSASVGAFDTVTLEADDAAALRAWLDENGYGVPDGLESVAADYVRDGWVFVVSALRRETDDDAVQRVHPLAFTFPADEAVYPMRLTGVGADALALDLFVLGDRRAEAPPLAVEHCAVEEPLLRYESWSFDATHEELLRRGRGAKILTRLVGTLDAAGMREDVHVAWRPFEELQRTYRTPAVAASRAAAWGATSVALALLLAAVWSRRVPAAAERLLCAFDARSFGVALALGGGAGLLAWDGRDLLPADARIAPPSAYSAWIDPAAAPDAARHDVAAARAWVASSLGGATNPLTGQPVREEDSLGNWTVRERAGRIEVVRYGSAGFERATEISTEGAPTAPVEGVVRTADGLPVADAMVRLFRSDSVQGDVVCYYGPLLCATTDAAGRFRVEVPRGLVWDAMVFGPRHVPVRIAGVDLRDPAAAPSFEVAAAPLVRGRVVVTGPRTVREILIRVPAVKGFPWLAGREVVLAAPGPFEIAGFVPGDAPVEVTVHAHRDPPSPPRGRGDPKVECMQHTVQLIPGAEPVEIRVE